MKKTYIAEFKGFSIKRQTEREYTHAVAAHYIDKDGKEGLGCLSFNGSAELAAKSMRQYLFLEDNTKYGKFKVYKLMILPCKLLEKAKK